MRAGPAKRWVRRARVFRMTKGFSGKRKSCYSIAVRAAEKAMQKQYVGRKLKKRDMRKLWITRIGIAAKEHGINYSRLVHHLAKADVELNRKSLAHLAVHEPHSFAALAALARQQHIEAQQGLALAAK